MADLPEAVLFDVDGTLVDSNYVHVLAWWEAFQQAGHDVPAVRIHRSIGMGSDKLLDALLPAGRDRNADETITAAHKALFTAHRSRLRPLPGAAALLRALKSRGITVVLASSADAEDLALLRRALDADDAIDAATSSSDAEESKPAPDLVETALAKAGTAPENTLFVGDAVWDVKAAGRAGVPCVALLSGGTGEAELREAGAVEVYADTEALRAALPFL
ncbi:HAD family hydrolase [Actinocorallia longicatena]|uniref:HAD family hydrolase n=1 Tax=Actinocorallia longicatena TaxID=111803 RepID=A0ABP6QLW3_9ACTN